MLDARLSNFSPSRSRFPEDRPQSYSNPKRQRGSSLPVSAVALCFGLSAARTPLGSLRLLNGLKILNSLNLFNFLNSLNTIFNSPIRLALPRTGNNPILSKLQISLFKLHSDGVAPVGAAYRGRAATRGAAFDGPESPLTAAPIINFSNFKLHSSNFS